VYVEGHEHDDLPPLVVRQVPQNQLRILVQHVDLLLQVVAQSVLVALLELLERPARPVQALANLYGPLVEPCLATFRTFFAHCVNFPHILSQSRTISNNLEQSRTISNNLERGPG